MSKNNNGGSSEDRAIRNDRTFRYSVDDPPTFDLRRPSTQAPRDQGPGNPDTKREAETKSSESDDDESDGSDAESDSDGNGGDDGGEEEHRDGSEGDDDKNENGGDGQNDGEEGNDRGSQDASDDNEQDASKDDVQDNDDDSNQKSNKDENNTGSKTKSFMEEEVEQSLREIHAIKSLEIMTGEVEALERGLARFARVERRRALSPGEQQQRELVYFTLIYSRERLEELANEANFGGNMAEEEVAGEDLVDEESSDEQPPTEEPSEELPGNVADGEVAGEESPDKEPTTGEPSETLQSDAATDSDASGGQQQGQHESLNPASGQANTSATWDPNKMWAVDRIVREQGKRYIVKWQPDENGTVWPDSYVSRSRVNAAAKNQWKADKREEARLKREQKKQDAQTEADIDGAASDDESEEEGGEQGEEER